MKRLKFHEFVTETSRDEHLLGRKMAPLKKILRRCECFIALLLAGSLLYVTFHTYPKHLHQEKIIFEQIVRHGKILFNFFTARFREFWLFFTE